MKYLIEYVYGDDVHDTKENTVLIEAELSEEADSKEANNIFKPLILQRTGHSGIKIMSYKQLD